MPPIRALVYSQQARRADAPPVGAWKCESKVGRAEARAQAAGGCGHGEARRSPERCLRNNTIDRIDIDENNAKREDARAIE